MTSTGPYAPVESGSGGEPVRLRVDITFHGPFRVGTGTAADGVTGGVDPADLLPASTLKGLMRASAARLLPGRPDLVEQVFGMRPADPPTGPEDSPRAPRAARGFDAGSPWHWSSASVQPPPSPSLDDTDDTDETDGSGPEADPSADSRAAGPGSTGDPARSPLPGGSGVQVTPRARIAIDAASGAARRDFLAVDHEVWARSATFVITQTGHLTPAQIRVHQVVLACAAAGVHALGADRRRGRGWVTLRPRNPAVDDALLDQLISLRSAKASTEAQADV